MSIYIKILSKSDDKDVINLLDEISASEGIGLAYHYPFYRDALEHIGIGTPLYLGAFKQNALVALLPGFIKSSVSGTVYNSLPFFGPNAGVQCLPVDNDCHAPLFSFLEDHLKNIPDMLSAAIYTPFLINNDTYYETLNADLVIDKFTHYIDFDNHTVPGVRRRDINTAHKRDVTMVDNPPQQTTAAIFDIYKQNCRDYGIELKPWKLFEYFQANNESDNLLITAAIHDERVIAGLVTLYSKGVASYYIPCQLHETRSLQPVPCLIDHHMQKVKKAGVRYWNWESSPGLDSGVAFFKKKWGSEEGQYKIHIKLYQPRTVFSKLGVKSIQTQFPHFFVYPFNLL